MSKTHVTIIILSFANINGHKTDLILATAIVFVLGAITNEHRSNCDFYKPRIAPGIITAKDLIFFVGAHFGTK